MKASFAKELRQNTLECIDRKSREDLGNWLEWVYQKIREAAGKGEDSVDIPLGDHGDAVPYRLEKDLRNVLHRDGYAIQYPNPTTRTISWE